MKAWRYTDAGPGWHGWYVRCYRQAREMTEAGGTVRMSWCGRDLDAEGFREEIRSALDTRINLKGGFDPCDGRNGRKYDPQYAINLKRDKWTLEDHLQRRIIVDFWHTDDARRHFGHMLRGRMEV